MKPQSSKEPTKKQRRALEILYLQFPTAMWSFSLYSNDIRVICPGHTYRITPAGKTINIHRNHFKELR